MNKKKLIVSLSIIGIVAAIAIGGTIAYFSDTETSVGNRFEAGDFDLLIDSTCKYNGQTQSSCTWLEKDLAGDLFFNFGDVKPGDSGEDTISFHIIDNPAWLCAEVANLVNQDNGCRKPEQKVDETCGDPGVGEGELQNNLFFTVWKDFNCDNIKNGDDYYVVQDQTALAGSWPIADSSTGTPIAGDTTICYAISWNVPLMTTTNIIQSDSLIGDITFTAVQSRNMDTFKCSDLQGGGAGPTCTPTGDEICDNGLDDDCDGTTDEGCQVAECAINADCDDGDVCTTDTCDGSLTCQHSNNSNSCNDGLYCNGLDTCSAGACMIHAGNQCPGHNVGPACNDSCSETNDNCTANDLNGTTCSGGSCQSGACVAVCVPTTEICDGIDNDCDGTTDEDWPNLGQTCDGSDADLCQEGTFVCSGGGQICSDATGDKTEVCGNGLDDDCDGSVDEGCVACVPITEICGDGIDQNCNGSDLACTQCASDAQCPMPNSCTTGACVSGTCVYTPHDFMCFNMNSCITATCSAQTGCGYQVTAGIGTSCSDMNCLMGSGGCGGFTCDINGACVAGSPTGGCTGVCIFGGTCTGGVLTCNPNPNCPNNCNDGNPCTIDSCILTGCMNTPKVCDDGNPNTADFCNPTDGQCTIYSMPDYGFCLALPWGGQWCLGD